MRVICSNCQAAYEVPEEKIPEKGLKVRCSKCQFVFEVKRAEQIVEAIEGEPKQKELPKTDEPTLQQRLQPQPSPVSETTPSTYLSELEGVVDKFKRQRRINSILGAVIIVIAAAIAGFLVWQFGIKPSIPKAPPIDPESVYFEAYDLFKKDTLDKYAEASNKLASLLVAYPAFAKGFALLSMCQAIQAELGHDMSLFEQSRLNLKKAFDLNKNLPEAYLAAAVLAIREGDYDNATDVLNSLEKMAPENPQFYTVKGELLYRQGRLDDALASFDEAIKRDSRDARALYLSALILKEKQDYAGALTRAKQVLEISHSHYDAMQLKVNIESIQAEKVKEVGQLAAVQKPVEEKKLPEQKPSEEQKPAVDEFQENFNKARSLFNKGRSSAALGYAQKAVQLNPRSCQAKTLLGWIYLDTGRLDEAKEQFNAATAGCPEALYGLGMVYKEQGQTQTAIMYLERFLATNPKGQDASEASRLLTTLRGE